MTPQNEKDLLKTLVLSPVPTSQTGEQPAPEGSNPGPEQGNSIASMLLKNQERVEAAEAAAADASREVTRVLGVLKWHRNIYNRWEFPAPLTPQTEAELTALELELGQLLVAKDTAHLEAYAAKVAEIESHPAQLEFDAALADAKIKSLAQNKIVDKYIEWSLSPAGLKGGSGWGDKEIALARARRATTPAWQDSIGRLVDAETELLGLDLKGKLAQAKRALSWVKGKSKKQKAALVAEWKKSK